jgi:hypothetical protein
VVYDSETGLTHCDVCKLSSRESPITTYPIWLLDTVYHICDYCLAHGAYWCQSCQDVHASPDCCPQPPLPAQLDGR